MSIAGIQRICYGYFRKVIVEFLDGERRFHVAKIALHPFSVGLLKNEAVGRVSANLQGASSPFIISDNKAVLLMTGEPGSQAPRSMWLNCPAPPFPYACNMLPVDVYRSRFSRSSTSSLWQNDIAMYVDILLNRVQNAALPIGESHGDFVYWNCLQSAQALTIIDFESYSEARIAGYDLWYWYVLPLVRLAVRRRQTRIFAGVLPLIARWLWRYRLVTADRNLAHCDQEPSLASDLSLGLTLLEHEAQMLEEHTFPDIIALIGKDAFALRKEVCRAYNLVLERVVRPG